MAGWLMDNELERKVEGAASKLWGSAPAFSGQTEETYEKVMLR
jgi:hypothetical protein